MSHNDNKDEEIKRLQLQLERKNQLLRKALSRIRQVENELVSHLEGNENATSNNSNHLEVSHHNDELADHEDEDNNHNSGIQNVSSLPTTTTTTSNDKVDLERLHEKKLSETMRRALRVSQLLCAFIGTLILNMMLYSDPANRSANFKDFVINYASDIISIGTVLILTDVLVAHALAAEGSKSFYDFATEFVSNLWNGTKLELKLAKTKIMDGTKGGSRRRRGSGSAGGEGESPQVNLAGNGNSNSNKKKRRRNVYGSEEDEEDEDEEHLGAERRELINIPSASAASSSSSSSSSS